MPHALLLTKHEEEEEEEEENQNVLSNNASLAPHRPFRLLLVVFLIHQSSSVKVNYLSLLRAPKWLCTVPLQSKKWIRPNSILLLFGFWFWG